MTKLTRPHNLLRIPTYATDEVTRPSLDSFQSSSPSTAPPTTPTRTDDNHLRDCKFSLDSTPTPSSPPPPHSDITPVANRIHPNQQQRERREGRLYDPRSVSAPRDPRPLPPSIRSESTSDEFGTEENDMPDHTLRRVGKRRPRPKLGVTTFAPNTTAIVLDSSPLSPVLASPRSQSHHHQPTRANSEPGHTPFTSSSSQFFFANRTPERSTDPVSPDVRLDTPTGQAAYVPNQMTPTGLLSPFGTTYIPTAEPENLDNSAHRSSSKPESHSQRLQYKPRKRVPTPRWRTTFHDVTTDGDTMTVMNQSSSMGVNELGALQEEAKGRRPSFSKWNFPTVNGGIGKSMMRRFSKLAVKTDLPLERDAPASADGHEPHPPRFAADMINKGYMSDGAKSAGTSGRRLSVAFSKLLPAGRRSQSITGHSTDSHGHGPSHQWPPVQTPILQPRSSLPFANGSHSSIAFSTGVSPGEPLPPVPRIGENRHSTITVRSSDGWFSTVPTSLVAASSSLPPSPAHNQTTFGAQMMRPMEMGNNGSQQDISRVVGRPSNNTSKTSLSPPSAYTLHGSQHALPEAINDTLKRLSAQSNSTTTMTPKASAIDNFPSPRASVATNPRPLSIPHTLSSSLPSEEGPLAPGSVRLLDVATAAALRKSIDFDDRVRKSESVLKSAIYGPDFSTSTGSGSRSSSFSSGVGRGRTNKGSSLSGRNSLNSRGQRSASVGVREFDSRPDHGLSTAGGVFLPTAVLQHQHQQHRRSPPMTHLNRSYNSTTTSSSGYSTPGHVAFVTPSRTSLGHSQQSTLASTFVGGSRTSVSASDEAHEKRHSHEKDVVPVKGALAHRLGRKISRIFVGKSSP